VLWRFGARCGIVRRPISNPRPPHLDNMLRLSLVGGSCRVVVALASLGAALPATAQNVRTARPPIIDIHVHTFGGGPGLGAMCPFPTAFLASDPKTKEDQIGWAKQDCALPLQPAATPDDYMKQVLAEYERLNVTAVVMGDPESVRKWHAAAPGRVIMGTAFSNGLAGGQYVPVDQLRQLYSNGGFQVMGEIGLQYEGKSPSDTSVDRYFALAEQLDIPVGIHMGTGGSGRANVTMPGFRGSMGNPLLLEDLLARHPKLRLWIMHAGYPMIDNLLSLLQANSHVYVDVAGLIWSYPKIEVDRYIQRIVEAGFEDRVMFGTDQLVWPKLMETSIDVIDRANYLTPEQKRDILYNNAARFLRLNQPGGAQTTKP
jgi:predicted TIM-barrel fold metal-dependent hydrolase